MENKNAGPALIVCGILELIGVAVILGYGYDRVGQVALFGCVVLVVSGLYTIVTGWQIHKNKGHASI